MQIQLLFQELPDLRYLSEAYSIIEETTRKAKCCSARMSEVADEMPQAESRSPCSFPESMTRDTNKSTTTTQLTTSTLTQIVASL